MKKKFNVIQINGYKGLIIAAGVVVCLFAGFIVFPGWVGMQAWNYMTEYFQAIPTIGLFQGILLWAIILITYFIFKKDRFIVCVRSPKGLTEEELKSVFADIKKQSQDDPVLQAMLKSREAELKLTHNEPEKNDAEASNIDSSKV